MGSVPHAKRFSVSARRLTSVFALLMAALALQTFGIAQTSTSDATKTSPATEVQATPASAGEETTTVTPAQADTTGPQPPTAAQIEAAGRRDDRDDPEIGRAPCRERVAI